ncbi:MAG: LysR family transcriptional regulator [Myxococcales bacterium]|nr:LysR family transcriptional regulator [Myxococcales bacterium]
MLLDNLKLFLLIVERGGMAAAGRELGLAPATVSARLAALEEYYDVRLLHRTTRSMSLTEEGQALLEGSRHLLADLEELDARVRLGAERLAGVIRLSAPIDLGRNWLVPLLDTFLAENPELQVDLHLGDGYIDLARTGVDLALRYGVLEDSTLRSRKLAEVQRVLCAAPDYLQRHGTPTHPSTLEHHDCLLMRFGEEADQHWSFRMDGGMRRITVRGRRISNDSELVRRWCIAGYGIARKSEIELRKDFADGRLVRILRDFELPPIALQVVFPGGRPPARRVRSLIERLMDAKASLEIF